VKRIQDRSRQYLIADVCTLYTMNELQLTHSIDILYEISTNYVSLYDTPLN